MAVIKEYKEFFLRATQVTGGAKPDKESNFPIVYTINNDGQLVPVNNRFLKGHFPSEDVFKKFMESIAFQLNPEDTASIEEQGLVRIATGYNVNERIDKDNVDENGTTHQYTTVMVPSTMPKVTGAGVSVVIRRSSDDAIVGSIAPTDRDLYYLEYQITQSTQIDNIGISSMLLDFDSDTVDENTLVQYDTDKTSLQQIQVPANWLATNGDYIEFDIRIDHTNVAGSGVGSEGFSLYTGTVTNEVAILQAFADSQNVEPDILSSPHITRSKIKLYRTSNTTAKIFAETMYYKPDGFSAFEPNNTADPGSARDAIGTLIANITGLDWTTIQEFHLVVDIATTSMNAAREFDLTSFIKAYKD